VLILFLAQTVAGVFSYNTKSLIRNEREEYKKLIEKDNHFKNSNRRVRLAK